MSAVKFLLQAANFSSRLSDLMFSTHYEMHMSGLKFQFFSHLVVVLMFMGASY
jgi:hypothetical protein